MLTECCWTGDNSHIKLVHYTDENKNFFFSFCLNSQSNSNYENSCFNF